MDNAIRELRSCIGAAHQVCGALEIEASADLIDSLRSELEEFRVGNGIFEN